MKLRKNETVGYIGKEIRDIKKKILIKYGKIIKTIMKITRKK